MRASHGTGLKARKRKQYVPSNPSGIVGIGAHPFELFVLHTVSVTAQQERNVQMNRMYVREQIRMSSLTSHLAEGVDGAGPDGLAGDTEDGVREVETESK